MIYQGKEAQEARDFEPISCTDFYTELEAAESAGHQGFGGPRPMPGPNLESQYMFMHAMLEH